MSQTRISRGAGLPVASDGSGRPRSAPALVVWLCWLVMFFDGFDLVMYGTVVPSLLDDEDWGLTPSG
ncbi:MAG: MFS transporter, partial [Comamonadaceae bacterium]